MLRAIGAVLVVAATSTFMLQQWTDGNDIVRYLTLLALTATLTGAEAMGFAQGDAVQLTGDIDDMFDRWEVRITQTESAGGVGLSTEDTFEGEYSTQEEQEDLRRELDEMRREDHE